jgi:hypothetical protein
VLEEGYACSISSTAVRVARMEEQDVETYLGEQAIIDLDDIAF